MKAKKYMIIGIFILMIALVGSVGTYAWFTWKSTSNTSLTMSIGKLADVTFTSGNDISTSTLSPVYNYTDGEVTTFSINNKDTSGTAISYNVKLNITSIATELKSTSLKYVLLKNNTIVQEGDFSTVSNDNTTIIYSDSISSSGTTDFKFYLYIDGNEENDISMMNKTLSGTLTVSGPTAAQLILNLYNNAEKKQITYNSITYNYAPSVGLMNDRKGSMATEINDGNVRYSGQTSKHQIQAWDSEMTDNLVNILSSRLKNFNVSPFTSEAECLTVTNAVTDCTNNYAALNYSDVATCEAGINELLQGMTGKSGTNATLLSIAQEKYCSKKVNAGEFENYIYFNCNNYNNQSDATCEKWRIIGVFDGKVKIMRNGSIGRYSWDNKDTTTGAETNNGKNDWSDARLMKLLNPGYESEPAGGSLYYNASSGNCYSGLNNATEPCDFTTTGIKNDTKKLISDTIYYLGGWNTPILYPDQTYNYERGTTVYSGRPTKWLGKIALAYASDYRYASDLDNCNEALSGYNSCAPSNWMVKMGTDNWALNASSDSSSYAWQTFLEDINSLFGSYYVADIMNVTPVLYLNSWVTIQKGTGSSIEPYQLSLN